MRPVEGPYNLDRERYFLQIIIFDLASLTAIRLSTAVVSPRSCLVT